MKRTMASTVLVVVSLGALISMGWAQGDQVSEQAKQFVHEAAKAGMAEVKLGKLAAKQASSSDVQQFGEHMVTDHTKANEKLKTIAEEKNIEVPTEMDTKHQQAAETLSKLQGEDFDRAYMHQMVEDHEKAVKLFSKEAQEGQDPDLKAFAAETLPTLQEHLKKASQLYQEQKVSQAR